MMPAAPLLAVQDLAIGFRSRHGLVPVVLDVSLAIAPGETLCLVGESGCGKTVTALALLGLLPRPSAGITGGRIFLDGQDLVGLSEEEWRAVRGRRIAMVFQEPMTSLNPVFTVGDQIGEAITVHERLPAAEVRARVISLLADVGIPAPEERLGDYPHQLSGGQRQRVMIAMALACRPQLLVADEPTTALDVTVQAQILALFADLKARHRQALLYITHDLGVVAHIADRVAVMYAGIIVEEGSRPQIFQAPAHPYTRGLLASRPDRSLRGQRLVTIPGSVPDPAERPAGCPFHPRCPHAITSCHTDFPSWCDRGAGHRHRCPVLAGQREA
ncbi:MAG: ABC transporter ATP-binding protein [Thermodesulfobacteriota bacterium]